MFLSILKKDLKRKKTMNIILLIFITLAAMFIASSANNLITVTSALDKYFEKAEVPDFWFSLVFQTDIEKFSEFAEKNGFEYKITDLIQIDPKDITIDSEVFDYKNTTCISSLNGSKVFDSDGYEITEINNGEIYVSAEIFNSNNFHDSEKIKISLNGKEKEFTLKGYVKDALFGSSMIGMTRMLVNKDDWEFFNDEQASIMSSVCVYTTDTEFNEKFMELELNLVFNADYSMIKMMYIMDMMNAATVLIVSICLILISMVILHFTINFTMSEAFREIGVMKAIGIPNNSIRGLYIAKYLAVSVIGALIGLALSIPFGKLLLANVSKNIIISSSDNFIINILCAVGAAAVVMLFCFFCTRKIKKFSPINAIRNGETGERFSGKGLIYLSRFRMPVIPFMAVNDILSGIKKYASMFVIFTLGILLIIIPINTINTLQSDNLITWFSMAECDHVILQETIFTPEGNNKEMIEHDLNDVRNTLSENNIEADIFQEIMFRISITHNGKKESSLAFQGMGDVTADMYNYIEGTPPQNKNEIAVTYIIADKIGADIGDDVDINLGTETRTYTVSAINESMNNMGEGIRFYQDEKLDYSYAGGCFGVQIKYTDNPDSKTLKERKALLESYYPDAEIYTAGEYINDMIGGIAGQLENVKTLILAVVICINMLVALLMVKSFITKEKSEIAILKAIGFKNSSLILWQIMRIGIILLMSAIIGALLSSPLSKLMIEPIFKIMGAYSIEFEINPFEVYAFYPLIVLAVTLLSAFISAQEIRKISASEASNIE